MTAEPSPHPTSETDAPRSIAPVEDVSSKSPAPPRWTPSWWLPAAAGVLAVALVGTAVFAYGESGDLSEARTTITGLRDRLARTEASLAAASAEGDRLTAQVGTLQAQAQRQLDCVSALQGDAAVARAIEDLQTKNYNLAAQRSAWAQASLARDKALHAALNDRYQAYSAAFNGAYSTANLWMDRSNAQIDIANAKLAKMRSEIEKMNALNHRIEGMLSTAGSGLGACSTTGSST